MFALLGVSLLKNKMGYCEGLSDFYEVGIYKVKLETLIYQMYFFF